MVDLYYGPLDTQHMTPLIHYTAAPSMAPDNVECRDDHMLISWDIGHHSFQVLLAYNTPPTQISTLFTY